MKKSFLTGLLALSVMLASLVWSASGRILSGWAKTGALSSAASLTKAFPVNGPTNGPACSSYTNKTTANGLGGNRVNGVYLVGTTVYAATHGGLSISTDGGSTFTNKTIANGLGHNQVNGVYAVGTTVYAATAGGLSISTDGGSTFTNKTTTNGLGHNVVRGVYAAGTTVYVATIGGLSISTDGGSTFTNKTTANGLGLNVVLGVYAAGTTVYAALNGALSISTDGGSTFTNKTTTDGLGNNTVRGVYAVGTTVYAATAGGLSISTNGGSTFTNRTTTDGLGNNSMLGVYAVGTTVYAATDGGLSISTNGGTSFTNYTTTNGLGNNQVFSVYATSAAVYAGTLGGLSFCSSSASVPVVAVSGNSNAITNGSTTPSTTNGTDFGSAAANTGPNAQSFTITNTGEGTLNLTGTPNKVVLSGTNAADFSIALQPTSPVAATNGTTTFLVNFAPTATGTRTATISIANDDTSNNPYTFAIQGTGTAAPANGPACDSFTNKTTANGLGSNLVLGVYTVGMTVYAATDGGLSISTDGGASFTNKTTANGLVSNNTLVVYATGSNVYVGTDLGLSISTDGGMSFTSKTSANGLGSNNVLGVYAAGSTVYAATGGGLSISMDGGASFTNYTTANGLGSNTVRGVYAVGSTVYAATNGGLAISTNGGASFSNKTTTDGLGDNTVFGVYAAGTMVYAATAGGLSISANGGASFTNYTTANGLNNDSVRGVYAAGNMVYAATNGGLAISTNGGASFTNYTTANGLGANATRSVFATTTALYVGTFGGLSFCSPPSCTAPALTMQPQSQTAEVGFGTQFNAAASGSPTPTVQWQISTDNGATFSDLVNETSTTLNLGALTIAQNGNQYRAVFTNSCGPVTSNAATLTVTCSAITLQPTSPALTAGTAGEAYVEQFTASYGDVGFAPRTFNKMAGPNATQATASFAFAVTLGALPPGLTLDPDGSLYGTPTSSGTYVFTVTATDDGSGGGSNRPSGPNQPTPLPVRTCSASQQYTLVINCPTITISPASLASGVINKSYSQTISATIPSLDGFQGPPTPLRLSGTARPTAVTNASFTYAKTLGTLPNGVTLNLDGTLGGTPTQSGDFTFTVTATAVFSGGVDALRPESLRDALSRPSIVLTPPPPVMGCTQTKQYTLTIRACLTTITVNAVGDATDVNPGDAVCETAAGNGICTLRAAVAEANALPACSPMTINFASPLFDTAQLITLSGSALNIQHPNLTISGPGADKVTVNQTAAFNNIITIQSGLIVQISGLKLTGGQSGGVKNFGGTVTLSNCEISGISGQQAVTNSSGTLTAQNCLIQNNMNGGIVNFGTLFTVTNCQILNNKAGSASAAGVYNSSNTLNLNDSTVAFNDGGSVGTGGIANFGTLTATNTKITDNKSTTFGGAGIYSSSGTMMLTDCTIANNMGAGAGGIRNFAALTMTGCTVANNEATDSSTSGGINHNSGTLTLSNSTISGNKANNSTGTNGGGVLLGSNATLTSCTITNNQAAGSNSAGGVIYPFGGTVTVTNTIIAGNTGTSGATADVNGGCCNTFTSGGYNLIADGTGGSGFSGTADQVGTSGSPLDPKLDGLADNGGPTQTHKLLSGSPALDKGKAFSLTTDQRGTGFNRTLDAAGIANANDGDGTDIGAFELACLSPTIASAPQPATVCAGGNTSFAVTADGTGPFSYQWKRGNTNVGTNSATLTLNGVTANDAGLYTVIITGACGMIETQPVLLTVNPVTSIVTPPQPQSLNTGQTAMFSVVATGTGPLHYQWKKGAANVGTDSPMFTINSVTPADNGNYSVVVMGACGTATSTAATLTVNGLPTIVAQAGSRPAGSAAVSLPIATVGDAETAASALGVMINNSASATSNGVTVSNLVNTNGVITAQVATECNATTASFTLKVTDGAGQTQTANLTITVSANTPPVVTYAAQAFPPGSTPSFNPASATDNGSITGYALQSITPNTGLALTVNANTGQISVTSATVAQSYTVVIRATDNCGAFADSSFSVTLPCPPTTLTPATLPRGLQGTAYNATVNAAPGGTTYSYAVTTNTLPPGLTLNSATGAITGTPTRAGNYSFNITATGWGACTKVQNFQILVTGTCVGLTFTPANLPGGTLGVPYPTQTLSVTGGTSPYTFVVTQGTLPAGLTLNSSTGELSGTPSAGGFVSFRVTVTGADGCSSSRTYLMNIACSTLQFSPSGLALPDATRGQQYMTQVAVVPAGTYTYTILLGQLPQGFTLNAQTGQISGITNQTGTFNVTIKALGGTCQGSKAYSLVVTSSQSALALQADYDGDRQSDPALWSAKDGIWRILQSSDQQAVSERWGQAGDLTLLGDYDGDGKSDLAVFRPADGTWYIKRSSDGSSFTKAWGVATDVPVPGDYDGDGQTDLAIFRPSEGNWYVLRSADQRVQVTSWGSGAAPYLDVAVPGDYDGDRQTDLAVFRRATGTWYVKRSSDGQVTVKAWGLGTDAPVMADYDGDGQTDLAVWRQGAWFIWQSASQSSRSQAWGESAAPYYDQAQPGDYDGDGQADLAVWRASTATWHIALSNTSAARVLSLGEPKDRPVSTRLQ